MGCTALGKMVGTALVVGMEAGNTRVVGNWVVDNRVVGSRAGGRMAQDNTAQSTACSMAYNKAVEARSKAAAEGMAWASLAT